MNEFFDGFPDLDISLLTKNGSEEKGSGATAEAEVKTTQTAKAKGKTEKAIEIDDTKNPFAPEETESTEDTDNTTDSAEDTDNQEDTAEESPIKMISSFLKEKGAIEYTDEEFRDDDEFIAETVTKTIDKKSAEGIQSYKDSLPDEIKQLIENYEDGVPLGQLLETEQKVYELSSITQDRIKEDSRLQEDLVESYMLSTGWSKEETNDRIKELQDAGIIEKEAVRAHSKLIQLEKANKENAIKQVQAEKAAANAKYQAQVNQLNTTIKNKKEFFENLPTNDIEKKAVFEAITKTDKTGRNKISQYLADPEMYLKTAYFLEVLKGDISKLKKAATTEVVKNTKKVLDGQPTKTESRFGGKNLAILNSFLKAKPKF